MTSSLAHAAPDVAAQWHRTKNGSLTPDRVLSTEHKLRWWSCPAGSDHVWRERTNARLARADGCPFCAGRRVSRTSSLATRSPRIAREWHPKKNGRVTPRDVVPASTSRFWWKCPEGPDHEWRATVAQRAIWGTRCPFCHGNRASITNALAVMAPRVAAEWHPKRNGELTPADVKVDSLRSVWWRCAKGHTWRRRIEHRTKRGIDCPRCATRPRARARARQPVP